MKVLFVCSGNSNSFEITPFIKEQGDSLKDHGIDVDYYTIKGKGALGYIKAGLKLYKHLNKNKYDLIHGHYTLSGWSAIIGSAGRIPIVLSLMGSDAYGEPIGQNKISLKSRIGMLLTLMAQPFVKAIISKSPNIEKHVYLKHKSHIIPNGINTEKFKQEILINGSMDHSNKGKKKILFLGNKTDIRKNYVLAQNAVSKLNFPDVEFINPYPVAHEEIPKLLNSANVLLVPSLMEGSPNVVKEAMACNCPIVATDTGDVTWVLGKTEGCYVTSFEVDEFADKIKQALDFSSNKGRTNGKERIMELGLDSKTIAKRIAAIYNNVVTKAMVTNN